MHQQAKCTHDTRFTFHCFACERIMQFVLPEGMYTLRGLGPWLHRNGMATWEDNAGRIYLFCSNACKRHHLDG